MGIYEGGVTMALETFLERFLDGIELEHTCELPPIQGCELPFCIRCKTTVNRVSLAGNCDECQEEIDRGYMLRRKAGCAYNGAHRDMGSVVHALPLEIYGYPQYGKALCGTKTGRLSIGWTDVWKEGVDKPTCKQCLNKVLKNENV